MNKRKLKRAKQPKKSKLPSPDLIISRKAKKTALAAQACEPSIDCIGNFIFFSTDSGYGWMLDHRNNYALRLAEKGNPAPYRINESKDKFQVEWKERYRLEDDIFIAVVNDTEESFTNCPVDAIEGLITMIKNSKKSP